VSYYTDWISSTIANNNNNNDPYPLVGDIKPWTEKPANIFKQTNSIKVENINNDNRITPKPTGISYFFHNGIYNWRKSTSSGLLFQTMTSSTRKFWLDYLEKMQFLKLFV